MFSVHRLIGPLASCIRNRPSERRRRRHEFSVAAEHLEDRTVLSGAAPVLAPIPDQTMSHTVDQIQVNLSATDNENDPLTFTAQVVNPNSLYQLDQQYGFYIDANFPENNYFYNARGVGEKYLRGPNNTWFLFWANGDLKQWGGSLNNLTKIANVGPDVFNDPTLLWNAQPTPGDQIVATVNGSVLTLNPPANFVGSVQVTVTAHDGTGSNSKTFTLNVTNQLPQVASIPDQTMRTNDPPLQINVAALDPDNDTLTYSASVAQGNLAYQLDQQYGFFIDANFPANNYFYNARGIGEKYLRGANDSWFLLFANGELKEWHGSVDSLTLVARLSGTYFNDPSLLWNAQALPADHINVTMNGNTLTIDPEDGFFGLYQVTVSVSDGFSTVKESFAVNVTADIPAPVNVTLEPLTNGTISGDTGEKPQSKVWQQGGQWWSIFPTAQGTYVWRLDGTTWTQVLQVSTLTSAKADVVVNGNLAHIILANGATTQFRTIEFVAGGAGSYQLWSTQPNIVNITGLNSSVETVTIDRDSTGRLWIAYEQDTQIVARYSDGNYSTWSAPIVLATGVNGDDIAAVTAMPGNKIGVLWSNQTTQRYGFRTHADGTDPNVWTADEVPAEQSALNVGVGMADDHINIAVKSDGTLYAAVKTGYNVVGFPALALLVRRPNGVWDDLYSIDPAGTRGIVQVSESTGAILYIYRDRDSSGPIMYRQLTDTGVGIVVGAEQLLFNGSPSPAADFNNPSSTKGGFNNELVVIGSGNGVLAGVKLTLGASPTGPTSNPDAYTLAEGGTLITTSGTGVLSNDISSGSGTMTVSLVSGPSFGTLTLNADGSFTYTHNGSENLSDSFTYRAQDGGGLGAVTTVTFTMTQVNDLPVANNDSYTVVKGGTLNANDANGTIPGTNNNSVLLNDVDAEGNPLTAVLVSGTSNGTLTLNPNGTFTYVHNGGSSTSDSFTYQANDGSGNSNIATANITVTTAPPVVLTTDLQDGLGGYNGTTDSYIIGNQATTNFGASRELELDGNPDKAALIRWELSGIPAGSTILSASIRLYVVDNSTDTFEIYALNRAFSEGQVNYQRAAVGQNWSGLGATGAADRGSTVLGVVTAPSTGYNTIDLNAAGVAVLQSWLNNPASNFGFIFQDYADASTNGLDFASSEATNTSTRPRLTITYSPPALQSAGGESLAGAAPIDASQLAEVKDAAIARLLDAAPPSYRAQVAAALSKVGLALADLPAGMLGMVSGSTIFVDSNAAGFGWFVDLTPGGDLEFGATDPSGALAALDGGPAAGRMDLLTVVMHEMGHYLGEGHHDELDLMHDTLSAGARRLPAQSDVDAVFGQLGTSIDSLLADI